MNSNESYSWKNQFISACLYYDTPSYSTDSITFVCSDHFQYIQYFQPNTNFSCSNFTTIRDQAAGSIYFYGCQMSRIKYNVCNVFRKLYTLNIESIELQYLPQEFFIGANFLTRLLASNNRLVEIVAGQFTFAPNLTEVDLSCNKINDVAGTAFKGTGFLQTLNLSHNHMETLHRNTFNDSTNLKVLDLSFNAIKKVENETFTNLSSLETLSLANNKLTTFPQGVLQQQMNLNIVNLSNNYLLVIELQVFGNLNNLELLDLSHNKLKKVVFSTMSSRHAHLETFRLNNNQLNDLNGFKHSMVPSLNLFSLNGNPFNCSYLESFLSDFDYHSSLSILDNSGTPIDIDNNIHGVNCVRNQSTIAKTDETSTTVEETKETKQVDHTEQNENDQALDIKNNLSNKSHDHSKNGLMIFVCVLSVISIVLIVGVFLWTRILMLKISSNITYSCAYNHGLEGRSPVATENDYEATLIGNTRHCCASNVNNN